MLAITSSFIKLQKKQLRSSVNDFLFEAPRTTPIRERQTNQLEYEDDCFLDCA